MTNLPPQIIQVGILLLVFGAIVSFALFFLGWLKIEKTWKKMDVSLILIGLVSLGMSTAIFTGSFAVTSLTPAGNFQTGIIFGPIGAVLLMIGMLKPCKFNLQIQDR